MATYYSKLFYTNALVSQYKQRQLCIGYSLPLLILKLHFINEARIDFPFFLYSLTLTTYVFSNPLNCDFLCLMDKVYNLTLSNVPKN